MKNLMHHIRQLRITVGFLDKSQASGLHHFPDFALHAVAAGQNHLDVRIDLLQHLQNLRAADARQNHIENHQINALFLFHINGNRFLTTGGLINGISQSPEHFGRMLGAIGQGGFRELKVINTLCKEAIKRQESAIALCKRVDVMFVLGGLHSANTRRLAELCKNHNRETFHLQNWDELDKTVLIGKEVAGVTAGASTPNWVIDEFVKHLEAFDEKEVNV